jgi:hypothetical protein
MPLSWQGAVKVCAVALPPFLRGLPAMAGMCLSMAHCLCSGCRRGCGVTSAVWDKFMPSGAALSPEAWRQGAKNCRRQPFLASLQFAEMKVYSEG